MKKPYLPLFIAALIVTLLLIWQFFGRSNQPQFFPLDDQNADYQITKNEEGIYSLSYSGKSPYEINTVFIGNSRQGLEQFIGKKVLVEGQFVKSDKQCIQQTCRDIYGPYIVLDITSLREK